VQKANGAVQRLPRLGIENALIQELLGVPIEKQLDRFGASLMSERSE